ncbi:unnamed protein product [Schistocephalus solidus]|uniref:C2H2-type domain-containing protein n=1 Tax=Schistocephalus solidus TaxID=70667 RepID=A0A3P7D8Q0_SCHSO|nr:unnamed protein product [Schistocephalus solidus]
MVGHLRTQCTNNPTIPNSALNSANPPSDAHTLTPGINSITPTIIETTSQYSSPVTSTTTAAAAAATNTSDGDSPLNCPNSDRTFTSRIVLVSHFRIHRTETGELVPGAPSHSRDLSLHCPQGPHGFTHHMNLFGQMRIHENLR